MSEGTTRLLLWLFVMNLGVALGAGLYEHRIVVPNWLRSADNAAAWNPDAARRDDTGRRFWAFVTTGPLTLITLANVFAARRARGELRFWWLAAGALALTDRALTFGYFIPAMVGLLNAAPTTESLVRAVRWSNLNYLRHAIVLAAWVAALRAFAIAYERR